MTDDHLDQAAQDIGRIEDADERVREQARAALQKADRILDQMRAERDDALLRRDRAEAVAERRRRQIQRLRAQEHQEHQEHQEPPFRL